MGILRLLAFPFACIFGALVFFKNRLYDLNLLSIKRLNRPVISVGNLSMGGAGKSPTVSGIIELLEEMGHSVGVLSRGYGRKNSGEAHLVDREGDWQLFGDEPMMLAKRHVNASVMVGPSRYDAALAGSEPDVYIIDDGMQHRQLHRDLEIVLLDVTQGYPKLFPMDTFREGWSSLRRADLVVLTRWDGHSDLTDWDMQIRRVNAKVPIVKTRFRHDTLVNAKTGEVIEISSIPDRKVAAYCGLARGDKFFKSLRELGLDVAIEKPLGDHQRLSDDMRDELLEACQKADIKVLVTTEKDLVKLDNYAKFDILLCSLSMKIDWDENEQIHATLARVMKADS